MQTREELISELKELGYLKSRRLESAIRKVDRRDFVPAELKSEAYGNYPLPIGHGQTMSQPLTIVFMLELADVKEGESILEVGTGSGWQTAILAELTGPKGKVISIERIKELHDFAKSNLAAYDYKNIDLKVGDGSKGYAPAAPYDIIIAGAESSSVPKAWEEQLKIGGRLIFPMDGSVYRFTKQKDDSFKKEENYGFAFVPLIED